MNDARRRRRRPKPMLLHSEAAAQRLKQTALLRNTDVMADVLGFLERKVIALRLASVSVAFSALCNCWCQPEEEEEQNDVEAYEASVEDVPTALSVPDENEQQQKRKWDQVSKSKK